MTLADPGAPRGLQRDNARVPDDPPDPMDSTVFAETRGETAHGVERSTSGSWSIVGSAGSRYALGPVIGVGGMGEVVAARDERIGRDVALKRIRVQHPPPVVLSRFLREARIQARLQHPAIVPVHELSEDATGRPFFTMARMSGVTLAQVLTARTATPAQRLLRAFADVCLAIEYAHARGVVHRDLKPANIILGEFGEVYVLDWGVARVLGDHDPVVATGTDTVDGMTQAGALLGTPGYMAPEQAAGAVDVGAAADVYALGAILFEIVSGDPLHPRGKRALSTTRAGVVGSPAARRPDRGVPPELDAICRAALAHDADARPSTRELAERVQRYLDGDRDHEHRRALAATHVETARRALAANEVGRRAEAMQAAGRALALDPESQDAAELVTHLILAPPRELPAELRAELAAAEVAVQRRQGRAATAAFGAVLVFLVAAAMSGLRSVPVFLGVVAFTLVLATLAWRLSRRAALPGEMLAIAVGNACLASVLSRTFGPLIVVPSVTCVMAVSLTSYPQLIERARIVVGILALSWLVPVALEAVGAVGETWTVVDGHVISTSNLFEIHGGATRALLIGGNVAAIVVIGLFANALAASRRDAQRQVTIQAWHLRQFLPARRT